jgi:hypothetical protein
MPTYQTLYRKVKVGAIVELRRGIETRGGVLLAGGLKMRVTRKHNGLHLETMNNKPCKACGIGQIHRVREVGLHDVKIITFGD